MKTRAFKQVDVFTAERYCGHPVAVVLDGSGLDDAAMQRFARCGMPPAQAAPLLMARKRPEARVLSEPVSLEVRAFAAPVGVEEDPVTGSLHASLAQWLIAEGVAAQGQALGRAGRAHVQRDADGQVWTGGASVTCIDGTVAL